MKRHFAHVQQRQKRVVKYGQPESASNKAPDSSGTKNYAMFAKSQEVRRRVRNQDRGLESSSNPGFDWQSNQSSNIASENAPEMPYQISAQQIRKNAAARTQNAESVEAIVSKVNFTIFFSTYRYNIYPFSLGYLELDG